MKLFAVVTNDWQTPGQELLEWQRGRAGTVEHTHRMLKDELAAGVYPSAKFGANAAWLRLQALTYNLLEVMKATALDEQYRQARPKRLRFAIFNHVGAIVISGAQAVMRVVTEVLNQVIGPGLGRARRQPGTRPKAQAHRDATTVTIRGTGGGSALAQRRQAALRPPPPLQRTPSTRAWTDFCPSEAR